jgi:hypothetical protein
MGPGGGVASFETVDVGEQGSNAADDLVLFGDGC